MSAHQDHPDDHGDLQARTQQSHHQVVVVRHGETEWARAGRHTGWTDVPLDRLGEQEASTVAGLLDGMTFARVLVSPLQRAVQTCWLAQLGDVAEVRDDLRERNYGVFEGRTTPEIQQGQPAWSVWDGDLPGGETLEQVGARADRVIAEVRSTPGDVAVFSHGHMLRILAARWLALGPVHGRDFVLDPAGLGILGYEHSDPVVVRWNITARLAGAH